MSDTFSDDDLIQAATDVDTPNLPPIGDSDLEDAARDVAVKDDDEETQKLGAVMEASLSKLPDRHASILEIARKTGAPTDVIEQRFPEFQQAFEASNLDARQFKAKNPELAKILLDRPELGPVVMRDERISALRNQLRGANATSTAVEAIVGSVGDITPDQAAKLPWYTRAAIAVAKLGLPDRQPAGIDEGVRKAMETVEGATPDIGRAAGSVPPRQVAVREERVAQGLTGLDRLSVPFIAGVVESRRLSHAKLHAELMDREMEGLDTWDLQKQIVDLERELAPRDYGSGAIEQVFVDSAEVAASQYQVMRDAGPLTALGAGAGLTLGALLGETPQAAGEGALKGASLFGKAGLALATFNLERGSAYAEMLQETTDNGKPIDRKVARGASLVYGALAAAVELASVGPVLSAYGPIGEAIKKGEGKAFLKSMLRDSTFRTIALDAVKKWGESSAAEGLEEFTQQVLQDMSEYAAKSITDRKLQTGPVASLDKALESLEKAALGSAVIGSAAPLLSITTQTLGRDTAIRAGAQVQAITGVADSPSVKAAPDVVAKLIEAETAKTGEKVTHLYVDPAAFQRLFQDENADPAEAARELLGDDGPRVLQEAVATGSKIEVPVALYLEKWGTKPVAEALVNDVTTRPGHLTLNELAKQTQEVEQKAQEIAKQFESETPPATESQSEQALVDEMVRGLTAGGMKADDAVKSTLPIRQFVRTMAARFGMDAGSLFDNFRIEIGNNQQAAAVNDEFAPAANILARRLKTLDAEGRARDVYIDNVSGLRNRKAFDSTPVPPGKQVAVITSTDVKGINDHPTAGGHDVANNLLRAMGAALFSVAPEAARSGTNFLLHVKDETELQAAVDAIRAAVGGEVTLEAGIGSDKEQAFGALTNRINEGRASGRIAPRGQTKLDVAKLSFPDGKANAAVQSEIAAKLAQLDEKAFFDQAYTIDGMLTREGWDNIPRKKNVVAFDLRGLGKANADFGNEVGDALIANFRATVVALGGSEHDATHLSGDEFALQDDDRAALEAFVAKLERALKGVKVWAADQETGDPAPVDVKFRFGIGADYGQADRDLNARRRAEAEPVGEDVSFDPAEFESAKEAAGSDEERKDDLGREEGAADRSGRIRPQAYPGKVETQLDKAKAAIARMRPENQVAATLWTKYVLGEREERPSISPDLERELAKYGLVDPEGYAYDEKGRSLERNIGGRRVKGAMPEEFRRLRIANLEHALGRTLRYDQSQRPEHVARELSVHEDRIRKEPVEHSVALDANGKVVLQKTSNHPSRVYFTLDEINGIKDSVFTHNHPRGRGLSSDDIYLAMFSDVSEMRAVGPDGTVWRVMRPERGWGFLREELREVLDDLRKLDRAVELASVSRMDRIVEAAGGKRADGVNAKGYTDELWNQIIEEEGIKAQNVVAKTRGWGWQVERLAPGEDGRRATGAERRGSEVQDAQLKLFHGPTDAPRGFMEMGRDGTTRIFRVVLNPTADLSTFLHESGHVFLEMFGDLADRPDAPESLKADLATSLKWLGVESRKDIQREHHEKWARGFERYLMEGKAPSLALVRAFERFKLWLKNIYRSISSLDVDLSDDIRGVFDRLLATDQEIERTEQAMGLSPLFRSPGDAGMTPEQWQSYLDDQERATSHAQRQAELRVMKDKLRETESWWKQELRVQKKVAQAEYDELPERRAQVFLEKAKGGVPDDTVAEMHGFATADQMRQAVAALKPKDAWVDEVSGSRMLEKHPDIAQDRSRLREVVGKGLHGEFTAKWLLREWDALRKKTGQQGGPPVESIKRAAELIVQRRTVQRLDAGSALRSERSAAENAAKAAAKGDYAQAYTFKQQQLLNHFMYRELAEARDARDAFLDLAQDLRKDKARARLRKADPVYRDSVDAILGAVGFGPQGAKFDAVDRMEADGATVMFDADAVASLVKQPRSWKALTVSEMHNVAAALKNIRAAARSMTTAIIDGKRVDRAGLVAELIADAEKNLPDLGPATSSREAETWLQGMGAGIQGIDGSLLKPETMLSWLAGGDQKSPWFRALMKPLQDAKAREADLLRQTVKPIVDAFDRIPAAIRKTLMDKVDGRKLFPDHRKDIEAPTRRFELLMMALNAGNESNLERLLDGRGISQSQMNKAIDLLSKEEMDWVQSIWDAAESLWPEARDLEERDSGLVPAQISPKPFQTRHGVYRGGYFPAVYDRRVEQVGERQAASNLASIFDQTYTRPGTPHSHLKGRAETFSGVISLSPGVIYSHLAQVAHDIAFRESLKSVGGILFDPAIDGALKRRLGDGRAKQFLQWLKDVGSMRAAQSNVHTAALNRMASAMKSNLAIGILGWSTTVAAGDLANLAVGATVVKAKHWAAGLTEFMINPSKTTDFMMEKSGEMRFRQDQISREFAKQVKSLTGRTPRAISWMRDHAFSFMEWTDKVTSAPIWLGAYREALADGRSDAAAIEHADVVIRKIFPSHSAVDQAAITRDKGFWGYNTLFYSYLSTMYQANRDIVHELHLAEDGADMAKRLPAVSGRLLALWASYGILSELLTGRGKEEGEDWDEWFLRKLLISPVQTLPGPVAGAIESLALGKKPSIRAAPAFAALESVFRAVQRARSGEADAVDELDAALRAVGAVGGLPTRPFTTTGKYLLDVATGDESPRDPADFIGGVVYGKREHQPTNPATALSGAISGD